MTENREHTIRWIAFTVMLLGLLVRPAQRCRRGRSPVLSSLTKMMMTTIARSGLTSS